MIVLMRIIYLLSTDQKIKAFKKYLEFQEQDIKDNFVTHSKAIKEVLAFLKETPFNLDLDLGDEQKEMFISVIADGTWRNAFICAIEAKKNPINDEKILLTLKNAAVTGDQSHSERYLHDLILTEDKGLWVVKVGDTPGQWFFGTLLKKGKPHLGATLSIQGNDWIWFNYGWAMDHLLSKMIKDNRLDITSQTTKYEAYFAPKDIVKKASKKKLYTDYGFYSISADGEIVGGWTYKQDALDDKKESDQEIRGKFKVEKISHHSRVNKEALERFNAKMGYAGNKTPEEE